MAVPTVSSVMILRLQFVVVEFQRRLEQHDKDDHLKLAGAVEVTQKVPTTT